MALVNVPEFEDKGGIVGAYYRVGDATIWAFDVEEDGDSMGRTVLTGHDDDGNEVEVHFYPETECTICGRDVEDRGHRVDTVLYCAECYDNEMSEEDE